MHRKFVVIKEIPASRDLMSFNTFDNIPVGEILEAVNNSCCLFYKGMNICDIGSTWESLYLKEVTSNV